MGGHFDAVGFGDPALGFEATREYLRAAIQRGRRVGETDSVIYFELETADGCGLTAATDQAGYLLNGCPYFVGQVGHAVTIQSLEAWEPGEPDQGGAIAMLKHDQSSDSTEIMFALPRYAVDLQRGLTGATHVSLVGLGYRAITTAPGRQPSYDTLPDRYFRPVGLERQLPPIRRCNVECRGRIERAAFLRNSETGAQLAYALIDCELLRLEVVIDRPSIEGGLAEGAMLQGSFWLVGRAAEA